MSRVRSFGHEEREIVCLEMWKVEVPDEMVMVWELELVVALVVLELRGVGLHTVRVTAMAINCTAVNSMQNPVHHLYISLLRCSTVRYG